MAFFDVLGNLAALFNQSSPTFGPPSPFTLGANAGAAGAGAGTTAAARAGTPTSPFPGYLSQEQQLALAQKMASGELGPILAEIRYQQQQAQAQTAAQVLAARGQAQAVAQKLAGIAPQVQAGYKQAADSQAGYAKGYSDQTQQTLDQSAAQSNDLLHTVAPNTKQTVGAPAISDLLFGTQGKLPADTLQTQGAAFTAAANLLPGTALGRGQQAETLAQSQGAANAAQLAHQAGTYAGQLPSLTQNALSDIQKQQLGLYNTDQTGRYRQAVLAGQGADRQIRVDAGNADRKLRAAISNADLTLRGRIANLQAREHDADRQTRVDLANQIATLQSQRNDIATIIATGVGPDGKLTASAEARLASAVGYDPVTGKPTAATLHSQNVDAFTAERLKIEKDRLALAVGNQKISYKRLIDSENQFVARLTDEHQKEAWTYAQEDAKARSQSGVIHHVIPDAHGDPLVEPWVLNGKPQFSAAFLKSHRAPALSPGQRLKLEGQVGSFAEGVFSGRTDPKTGVHHPALSYEDAIKEGIVSYGTQYLPLILQKLNLVYPEGVQGRPFEAPSLLKLAGSGDLSFERNADGSISVYHGNDSEPVQIVTPADAVARQLRPFLTGPSYDYSGAGPMTGNAAGAPSWQPAAAPAGVTLPPPPAPGKLTVPDTNWQR